MCYSSWIMNFTSKQIWLINYPVMMSVLVEQLINITDAIFLGHVGETELGASAIAGMYYLSLYILGFGFSLGLQVMIARRNGEQRPTETGKVFFQGLFFLTTLAVTLFGLSKIFTPFILQRLLTSRKYTRLLYNIWTGEHSACFSPFRCWPSGHFSWESPKPVYSPSLPSL